MQETLKKNRVQHSFLIHSNIELMQNKEKITDNNGHHQYGGPSSLWVTSYVTTMKIIIN